MMEEKNEFNPIISKGDTLICVGILVLIVVFILINANFFVHFPDWQFIVLHPEP